DALPITNAMQHLELELIRADSLLRNELPGLGDDGLVMRCQAWIVPHFEQTLHLAYVGLVNIALVGIGNRCRLLVRTLAQPHASAGANGVLHVLRSTAQCGWLNDANLPLKCRSHVLVEILDPNLRIIAAFQF